MQWLHGHFIKADTLLEKFKLLTIFNNLKSRMSSNNKGSHDIQIMYNGHDAITDDTLMHVTNPSPRKNLIKW